MTDFSVIGAGAQAKYAIEILTSKGYSFSIYDPIGNKVGKTLFGNPILKLESPEQVTNTMCVLCLKDNKKKEILYYSLRNFATRFPSQVHTRAIIASNANYGFGNIINPGALLQTSASVGNFCMIHAGVIIEHDCRIDSFVNIAPGAILTGGAYIGEFSYIYSGAIIGPGVKIGKGSVIGAGSVVLRDVPENSFFGGDYNGQRTTCSKVATVG